MWLMMKNPRVNIIKCSMLLLSVIVSSAAQDEEENEEKQSEASKRRWLLVPDPDLKMQMVDYNVYKPTPGPSFEAQLDVKFFLSTRNKREEEIERRLESIEASSFNKENPTRITIHGWLGNASSTSEIVDAYLKKGDYNCIVVDWSVGAGTLDYIKARYRVEDTALHVADLVDFLSEEKLLKLDDLHIVGHSLGAQIAGLTGKYIKEGTVRAIYGLDPAASLFFCDEPEDRIAATDATYVEILHTTAWELAYGGPLGHVDYYPNFGREQPGCEKDLRCSHMRAMELFAESINSNDFGATRCNSIKDIGKQICTAHWPAFTTVMTSEPANYKLEGYFYFETNDKPPYAKG